MYDMGYNLAVIAVNQFYWYSLLDDSMLTFHVIKVE